MTEKGNHLKSIPLNVETLNVHPSGRLYADSPNTSPSPMRQRNSPNKSPALNNSTTLHLINTQTVLQTKRGKNNPSHVFVKPKYTRDPTKKQLDRVI